MLLKTHTHSSRQGNIFLLKRLKPNKDAGYFACCLTSPDDKHYFFWQSEVTSLFLVFCSEVSLPLFPQYSRYGFFATVIEKRNEEIKPLGLGYKNGLSEFWFILYCTAFFVA